MKKLLYILLFTALTFTVNAQFYYTNGKGDLIFKHGAGYRGPAAPVYDHTTTPDPTTPTTYGTILWSQDFNNEAIDASVSDAEIRTIIGEPCNIYNFDNNGQQKIIEYATGDNAFSGRMDLGGSGGGGGWQIEKTLREDCSADADLNNLTELWMSYNVWFPEGFSTSTEGTDGKMPGGLRGSYAFWPGYEPDPNEGGGWETFVDGFLVRKYYQPDSPINGHRHLIYWKDMTYDYGMKGGVYYPDWPTNAGSSSVVSTTPQNVAIRLKLNTDKDTYDGVLEVYINERLSYSDYGKRFRVSDTVNIDWALWSFFPNSSGATLDDYLCVIDDLYLFTFADSDSTVTGNEHMSAPYTVDVPGWPKGEDITDWGKFGAAGTDYTVYKTIDFGEYALGAIDQARARQFTGSDEMGYSGSTDSTVIENRGDVTDTVWQVYMPAVSAQAGSQWYGKMKLNGTNYAADTFTYVRFSYYMKLSESFDFSNGGKLPGLYADGIDNDGTGLFPAGWYSPGCEPLTPVIDPEWGCTCLGVFDGPNGYGDESLGMYLGYYNAHENSCSNKNYDEVWVMDNSPTDGDAPSTTIDLDGTFPENEWFKVTLGIKLNTVTVEGTGDANGSVTWSRNDTCMGVMTGMILRNYSSIKIDYLGNKVFYGGSSDPARTSTNITWFDDYIIWADDDRTLPVLNEVETNVPDMPTPNTD